MFDKRSFDVAIAGGGLAGLSLAIQLARQGFEVIVFEKEKYPYHKVCGEYISLESWDFLKQLGLDLDGMQLPIIKRLQLSSAGGNLFEHKLPLGGFGISRYKLDHSLARLAAGAGALVVENSKVSDVRFEDDAFLIESQKAVCSARVVAGCYGKRSNIDVKWKRPFVQARPGRLNNYVGVKYHIEMDFPSDTIALHHFHDGYCGIVRIEDGQCNLCYLTKSSNLHLFGDIPAMEKNVLAKNPFLRDIFSSGRFITGTPVTIAQISFEKKSQVEQHVLMIGDAAGMITPLCGNGMSMALHAGKIAAEQIRLFLSNQISRARMENEYIRLWQSAFTGRLRTGRLVQRLFSDKLLAAASVYLGNRLPFLMNYLIRSTHGSPF